jgi:hypothetical protein
LSGLNKPGHSGQSSGEQQTRVVGSPLPTGSSSGRLSVAQGDLRPISAAPPPGRALANSSSASSSAEDAPSGVQWFVSAVRGALPFVQKLLPLLDGNIGSAVSNMLTHQPHPHTPPPAPPVNLQPIEDSLAELRTQHSDLRDQIVEQNTSLKKVEDQLEMVREATDRNTLEQQELLEDLKAVGKKVTLFAWFALALLAVSIALNVILFLHLKRVLP